MMEFLTEPKVLSLVVGVCVFICVYFWYDKIVNFLQTKALKSQSEILDIMDKMLIPTERSKIKKSLWGVSIAFGSLFFILVWPNVLVGFAFFIIAFLSFWFASVFIMRSLWQTRCKTVVNDLVEGLIIMTNGIKVGLSVGQTLERVVKNVKGPLATEFQLILKKMQLGMTMEDALTEFGDKIDKPDTTMLVTAINILKETGGNLGETFATIAYTIQERQKLEKKIDALTAQGVMQGTIISIIPFVLLIIFYVLDPNYVMPLFTKPLGWFFLVLAVILIGFGAVLMKKMIDIKI